MNIRFLLSTALILTLLVGFNFTASAHGRCHRGPRPRVVVNYCPPPPMMMAPPVVAYYPRPRYVARPRYCAGNYYRHSYHGHPGGYNGQRNAYRR